MKKESINLNIELDDSNMPEKITWDASDKPNPGAEECKAFMLSMWDKNQKNTFRIDLWTKEMQVDEMNFFFCQSLITMAETFNRATNNKEAGKKVIDFVNKLAKDLKIEQ